MKNFKNILKKIPLALKLINFLFVELPKLKKARVVFIFPYHHFGGAEKIHLQIVESTNESLTKNYLLFTKKSKVSNGISGFKTFVNCTEIFSFIKHNGLFKNFFFNKICNTINTSSVETVFGCNTEFFYELLPYLKNDIKKIDLIHAFSLPDYGLEQFSIPYIKFLTNRIVINEKTKNDFKKQYKSIAISPVYLDKIIVIENALPKITTINRISDKKFRIGYIGRWSKEKRPELFIEVANKFRSNYENTSVRMAGFIPKKGQLNSIIYDGILTSVSGISNFYNSIDVLLITSYREGMPLVLIEAMQHGVVVISINVGSISEHIKNDITGYLVDNNKNINIIINEIYKKLEVLYNDREKLKMIASESLKYVNDNFSIDKFNQSYKSVLLNGK